MRKVLGVLSPVFDENDESLSSVRRAALRDFLSDCLYPQLGQPADLSWWQKAVWSSVFALMLLVATGGNAIVMWIVLGEQSLDL